jgi:hypothetical protein
MHFNNSGKEKRMGNRVIQKPARPETQQLSHGRVLLKLSHTSCVHTVEFGSSDLKSLVKLFFNVLFKPRSKMQTYQTTMSMKTRASDIPHINNSSRQTLVMVMDELC